MVNVNFKFCKRALDGLNFSYVGQGAAKPAKFIFSDGSNIAKTFLYYFKSLLDSW